MTCGITFTFGGLRIDPETGQVLDVELPSDPRALHRGRDGRRPVLLQLSGGTGLVSGAVFGRIAGNGAAAAALAGQPAAAGGPALRSRA